jgi:peptidoglycan-associated lipoprotein
MRRLALSIAVALALVLFTATTGCRPDDVPPDTDTTAVFDTDTLVSDTLGTGVWDTDTVETSTDTLALHQERLRDVFFGFDTSELSAEAMDSLMHNASYIMANGGFRVLLEGHCDERGTIEYNLALGEQRAQAVYDYLVEYGVSPSRLQTVSYGKERPFVEGHTEAAWAKNRRVHLRVMPGL